MTGTKLVARASAGLIPRRAGITSYVPSRELHWVATITIVAIVTILFVIRKPSFGSGSSILDGISAVAGVLS